MKFGVVVAVAIAIFVAAAVGLWRTVGGLVEQAGVRELQPVVLDVQFALKDAAGQPLGNAPVRLVFGDDPEQQPAAAGKSFVTDAGGGYAFTTKTVMNKVQRKRPTNFFSSLTASPELTDHLGVGAELGYMNYRWFYVAHLYRFPDGDILHAGVTLYTRDDHGQFSRRAEPAGDGGWTIADLGAMRMTTIGHEFSLISFERSQPDHWALSVSFTRQPEPIVR